MVNKVILLGNLGKDPDVLNLDNGMKKTSFPLATTENYKDKDGNKVNKTEWHKIVSFGKVAEIAETYLRKGNKVYIEGKLVSRSWEDKDGNKRYITEVLLNNLVMLGSNEKPIQDDNDDVPF